jgi:diacylglycerol kinase (ATP)
MLFSELKKLYSWDFSDSHNRRLVQAHKVKIEFHKGGVDHTYMRVDGEPWLQNLPPDDEPTVLEITHKGQAVALTYGDCISKPLSQEGSRRLPISTASFPKALTASSHNSIEEAGEEGEGTPAAAAS